MTTPLIPGQAVRPLHISGTPVEEADKDTPYAGFTVSATGGTTPYTFSVFSGAFPAGITINPNSGVVSGTPTEDGVFADIVLGVTDVHGRTASLASFDLTVGAILTISGTPDTIAEVGVAYDFQPTAANGTEPYTFTVHTGTLPSGVTIDSGTGEVSGSPDTPGTSTGIVIRVTDDVGAHADLDPFDIDVADAVSISGTPVETATQDRPYTGFTVSAADGVAPYVFSVHAGTLPTGVTLNASTGVVSGTPTAAANYTGIVIRVTDALGGTDDLATFAILVADPVGISGTPVTTATVDTPYTGFTVTGSDGTEPYTFSVHAGTLPTGITLDPDTGEVAGTPTVEEEQDGIVIRVTDAYGSTADLASFDLTVSAASGYTTGGVVFDGAAMLTNLALVATDNQVWSASWWAWVTDDPAGGFQFFVQEPSSYNNYAQTTTNPSGGTYPVQFSGGDEASTAYAAGSVTGIAAGAWVNFIQAVDGTTTPVTVRAAVNGTPVVLSDDFHSGGNATFSFNGKPIYIAGSGSPNALGYLADVWIAPGQFLDIDSPANVAKFISGGKPVDLGSDGSTPTGTAPAIFLRRAPAAAASTFATNLGTGGNFTITGTLTNSPSSPSD